MPNLASRYHSGQQNVRRLSRFGAKVPLCRCQIGIRSSWVPPIFFPIKCGFVLQQRGDPGRKGPRPPPALRRRAQPGPRRGTRAAPRGRRPWPRGIPPPPPGGAPPAPRRGGWQRRVLQQEERARHVQPRVPPGPGSPSPAPAIARPGRRRCPGANPRGRGPPPREATGRARAPPGAAPPPEARGRSVRPGAHAHRAGRPAAGRARRGMPRCGPQGPAPPGAASPPRSIRSSRLWPRTRSKTIPSRPRARIRPWQRGAARPCASAQRAPRSSASTASAGTPG